MSEPVDIKVLKTRILPACPQEVTEYIEYLESAIKEQQVLGEQLIAKLGEIEEKVQKLIVTECSN